MQTSKILTFGILLILLCGAFATDVIAGSKKNKCKVIVQVYGLTYTSSGEAQYKNLKSRIYLNGVGMGNYYRRTYWLTPSDNLVLTVEHSGYYPYASEPFNCKAGETKHFDANMESTACVVRVHVSLNSFWDYPEAYISIDGKSTGRETNYKVVYPAPGAHRIEAKKDGYYPDSEDITCSANQPLDVYFHLIKIRK